VGNPAHIVQKDVGKQREEATARVFAAYGVTLSSGEDPLSTALHKLIDHAAAQDEQMQKILVALKNAGVGCEGMPDTSRLNPDQLNKLVE
jgi:serine O-acetyltransferase